MMHRLRRYDGFHFAQNDVAPFGRNDAMFAQCAVRHTSLGEAQHHLPQANIIQKNAPLSVDKSAFFVALNE